MAGVWGSNPSVSAMNNPDQGHFCFGVRTIWEESARVSSLRAGACPVGGACQTSASRRFARIPMSSTWHATGTMRRGDRFPPSPGAGRCPRLEPAEQSTDRCSPARRGKCRSAKASPVASSVVHCHDLVVRYSPRLLEQAGPDRLRRWSRPLISDRHAIEYRRGR